MQKLLKQHLNKSLYSIKKLNSLDKAGTVIVFHICHLLIPFFIYWVSLRRPAIKLLVFLKFVSLVSTKSSWMDLIFVAWFVLVCQLFNRLCFIWQSSHYEGFQYKTVIRCLSQTPNSFAEKENLSWIIIYFWKTNRFTSFMNKSLMTNFV